MRVNFIRISHPIKMIQMRSRRIKMNEMCSQSIQIRTHDKYLRTKLTEILLNYLICMMDSNEFGVFTVEIREPEQLGFWMKQKNPKVNLNLNYFDWL